MIKTFRNSALTFLILMSLSSILAIIYAIFGNIIGALIMLALVIFDFFMIMRAIKYMNKYIVLEHSKTELNRRINNLKIKRKEIEYNRRINKIIDRLNKIADNIAIQKALIEEREKKLKLSPKKLSPKSKTKYWVWNK